MSDMSLTFRVQAEMAQAKAELASGVAALQKFGAAAKQAMREGSIGNTALTNSFEVLRASIDPTFAAQQKFAAIQQELAGMVERGEASQMAANIVLEQAAVKYNGATSATERYKASQVEAAAATQAAAREAADLQARFTGLRASIDPAYAASLRFADAQMITQRAVAAGIATEAEAAAVLDGLRAKMDLAAGAAGRFETAQMAAGRSAQANAMVTGNVAAQFNDIGVMLAAGQNPFMLAIQQGTQLSQVLNQVGGGAKGAVAALKAGFMAMLSPTTLLTMAVIAGGAALVQWATSADLAEEKSAEMKARIDELTTALRELDSATGAAGEPMSKLVSKYGDLAGAVRDARLQMADDAFQKAKEGFNDLVDSTEFAEFPKLEIIVGLKDGPNGFSSYEAQINLLRQKIEREAAAARESMSFYSPDADIAKIKALEGRANIAKAYVASIRDEFQITEQQAQGLAEALVRMNEAGDAHEQVATAQAFNAELIKVFGSARAANEATGGMVTALAEAIEKGSDLAALSGQITGRFQEGDGAINAVRIALDDALAAAEALAGADIAGNISRALGPAAALASRLWSAANAMAAAASMGEQQPPLRGPAGMGDGDSAFASMRDRRLAEEKARAEAWREAWGDGGGVTGSSGSGSGSTGGAGDGLADLSAKAQAIMADLDLAIAAINEKVKAGLMSTAEAADAVQSAKASAGDSVAELIAQIDRLGPAGAAAAEELRRQLPQLAADLNKDIGDLSKTLAEGFASPFKYFIKGSIDAGTAFEKFGDAVIDKLSDMAAQQFELSVLQPLFDSIFGGFSFGAIPGHAGGGEIVGKGTGTSDSNLRRLSHGEFVVNAIATGKNRDTLKAINAGAVVDVAPPPVPRWPGFGAPRQDIPQEILREAQQRMADPDRVLRSIMAGLPDPARMMPAMTPAAAQAAPQMVRQIFNVINNVGPEVRVTQSERTQGNDQIIEAVLDRVEAGLAGNMARGVGPLNDVFTSSFGLTRRGR